MTARVNHISAIQVNAAPLLQRNLSTREAARILARQGAVPVASWGDGTGRRAKAARQIRCANGELILVRALIDFGPHELSQLLG